MENLTGQRFGKLIALSPAGKSNSGRVLWLCQCDCGSTKVILAHSLKIGDTSSCGCEHYKKRPATDLAGRRFGRLTVVEYAGSSCFKCRCDCGKEVVISTDRLNSGRTKSCGCLRKEVAASKATKHGGCKEPLYAVLSAMHQRCENPNCYDYKFYGAKGVKVCVEWALTNYPVFRSWAKETGYRHGLTIDRINPEGDYRPENCRWLSIEDQQRNKRSRSYTT